VGTDYILEKLPYVSGPGLVEVGRYINDLIGGQEDLTTSWTRSDKEGTTGDVSVIAQV